MAVALVGGAAIGALFGALYDVVKESVGRTAKQYKTLLGDLKFTLDSLRPRIIQQIGDHNLELGLPNEDIERLQTQMEEGTELIRKLSNIGMWNCYMWCSCCNCTKPSYTDQLTELDRSLRILLEILKLQEVRDVKEVLLLARKIHDKQDELEGRMSDLLRVQQEAGNGAESSSGTSAQTTVPERNEGNAGQQGVGTVALGAVFGVLFDTVMQVKDNVIMLNRPLEDLKSTLDSLKPLIEETSEYNKVLNLPKEELENVRNKIENGVELLLKCSKVRQWTSNKKYEYSNKLLGLDESLQRLLNILRVQLARNVRETLVSVRNMETVINQIEGNGMEQVQNEQIESKGSCEVQNDTSHSHHSCAYSFESLQDEDLICVSPEPSYTSNIEVVQTQAATQVAESPPTTDRLDAMSMQLGTRDANETTSVRTTEVGLEQNQGKGALEPEASDAKNVPSEVTIGLDLKELKRELLKDEVSTLVLNGPEKCGITRLAKRLCLDEEVKKRFNFILFVSVSKQPNLCLIVQKLFQQLERTGLQVPFLPDEATALKFLQQLLKGTGLQPSLLVLDDVWPGSESLLNKFYELKTPNHKILVTTRHEFPKFGPHYYLHSLKSTNKLPYHSRPYSFETLQDEDLIRVSPEPYFVTSIDEEPMAHFHDPYLRDKGSYVSKDVGPMAHLQDSSASSAGDRSSLASKDVGTKFPLENPVKSSQTYMQQKLELKVSAGDKTMKKVMKTVAEIDGVDSISWDVHNQKLTVVGQLDPVLIATKLRKIASKTEVISVGPAKEEIKEDKKDRFLAMKDRKEEETEESKERFLDTQLPR